MGGGISLNSIVEILPKKVDTDGWDTGILKEIIYFWSYPDVSVPRGKSSFTTLDEFY